ncbi:MAG: S8/S53 family peptidase [Myxococcota bacterium]
MRKRNQLPGRTIAVEKTTPKHAVWVPSSFLAVTVLACAPSDDSGLSDATDEFRLNTAAVGAPSHPGAPPSTPPRGVEGRPCRPDLIFLERTLWSPRAPNTFAGDLEQAIDNSLVPKWFCDPGDAACLANAGAIQTRVTSLLPERVGYGRDEGHQRFFRLFFVSMPTPTRVAPTATSRIPVRDSEICEVVQMVRRAAVDVSRLDDGWRIGRECEAMGSGISELVSDAARRWHTDRLGVSSDDSAGEKVGIALIDSGVLNKAQAALGVKSVYDGVDESLGSGDATPPDTRHVHATAMAAYLREVVPAAPILDYRVLNAGGLATVGGLARAIDQALSDVDDVESLIINLSVGVAPEYSNRSWLRASDDSCEVIEDGVGESLRFVLDVARNRDAASEPRVLVVAAGGNRTLGGDAASVFYPALPYAESPCGPSAAGSDDVSFLPGMYGELPSCRSALDPARTLTLTTGAVDSRDRPSIVSLRAAEPALVAPGQKVYADHPGLPEASPGINCLTESGPENGLHFPMPLTGTSVSTALTAGAAALAQSRYSAGSGNSLSAGHLARLLYLTGENTCRESGGVPVRRLSVVRLETALDTCPGLVACAESATGSFADIDATTRDSCAAELVACGLESWDQDESGVAEVCVQHNQVRAYPDDVTDRLTCPEGAVDCVTSEPGCIDVCGPNEIDAGECSASPPTLSEQPVDRYVLGGTGPQPETSGCLDCGGMSKPSVSPLNFASPNLVLDLVLTLNPYLPVDAEFSFPTVVITDANGESVDTIPIDGLTDTSAWKPGAVVVIPNVDLKALCTKPMCAAAVDGLGETHELQLTMAITAGGQSGWDSSSLTVY